MASFNIDSVTIKGFKGFTTSQRIDVGCRNLFVFGENGRGKSSVLESIRWCIWGGEQETLLRNTFYPDDCEVELGLRGPDGVWRLRRRMRLVGGRSDVQLFNPSGQRVPYEQMFPHLPRITGEGTYVILAEQQARGRAFVDITRFDSVLYAYIGLLEDKAFLERLGTLQEEFEKVKNELETKATELRKGQQEALSIVEEDLSRLLTRPPWDTETTPTFDETVEKIRVFGIAAGVSEPLPLNSPHVALGHIENSLTSDKSKESEDPAVKTTEETLHALSLLLVERTTKEVTLSALDTQLTQRTKELDALLGEETLDDIRQSVTRIYEGARTKVLETEIVQSSRDLIERTGQQGCPVCSSHTNGLLVMLREKSETISTQEREILEEQRAMKARSEKAIETSQKLEDIQASTEEVRGEQRKLDLELQTLLEVDEGEELTDKAIRDRRTELQAHMDGLRQAQDHREQWYEDYLRTGRKLREELSYHELRDRQANIQRRLEEGFAGFNRSFETFLGSIESVEEIKVALPRTPERDLDLKSLLAHRPPLG